MNQSSVLLAQSAFSQKYLCHYGSKTFAATLPSNFDSDMDMLLTAQTKNMTAKYSHKQNHQNEITEALSETAVTYVPFLTAVISTGRINEAKNLRKKARRYEVYRERIHISGKGMSHTVTSRELVYQVPHQKRRFRRFVL